MKSINVLSLLVLAAVSANASSFPERSLQLDHHHRLARQVADVKVVKRGTAKRCKKKPTLSSSSSDSGKTPAPSPKENNPPSDSNSNNNNNNNSGGSPPSGGAKGLISVQSNCGAIGATQQITPTSGPNGNIDWLNCGVNDGGWRPPMVRVQDVIVANLPDAIKASDSPFKACNQYVGMFEKYGGEFGVPSIFLASFALQESSCNPETVGGGGEQGLMQLTKDKCGGAPGGNCRDPDFNIRTGAKFFADTLNGVGGNVLLAVGQYNGWQKGLTVGSATAARNSNCCRCQNNLDYLHQFFNGWLQNKNAYGNPPLGKYFNLNVCG